jgi:hypothetical protein
MGDAARRFAISRDWPSSFAPLFNTYRELLVGRTHAPSLALEPVL